MKSSSEDSKWEFKKFLSFITNVHIEISMWERLKSQNFYVVPQTKKS